MVAATDGLDTPGWRRHLPQSPGLSRHAWTYGVIAGAAAMTTVDAALLQRKKSFFTGGFLVATHATNLAETIGFLLGSLVVDASIIGVLAVCLLWLFSRARLTRLARFTLVMCAVAPLVIWDFINYSLLAYLGDAFDLGLMFDLTGRDPGEVLAVASSHLLAPGALILAAVAALAGTVWTLNWYEAPSARSRTHVPRRLAAAAGGLFLVGLLTSTAASSASDLLEDGLRRKASGQVFMRLTAALTDFDGDGFGIGGRTSDPAPFNGAIYPYALDLPGNGIDEDALGGDLRSTEPPYTEAAAAQPFRHRPNVVFFMLESFRADAVGRVVNGIPVTPVLDGLAREGMSSSLAFSHNGYTSQSRFHTFTGSLAGVRQDGSLVDDFNANGYQTAYFSAQDESFGGSSLGVGFDRAEVAYDARQDRGRRYSTYTTAGSLAVSHATLQQRIEAFLETRDSGRPLFLYVNFHDTHFPYHHGEIAPLVSSNLLPRAQIRPSRKDAVQETYYNAAANVDRALGSTLEAVTRALGSPPAVIVTADHGESLFDEGFLGHGYALNDVQTRIPLIVRRLPLEIAEPFGQVDLRSAIGKALSRSDRQDAMPRVFLDPD
jgi:hypothetical protein